MHQHAAPLDALPSLHEPALPRGLGKRHKSSRARQPPVFARIGSAMSAMAIREIPGLHARSALTPEQRDEMFALLDLHFDGVSRAQFERDLAEKNWVIELRHDRRL